VERARPLLEPLPPSAEHARLYVWEARLALIGRQDTAEGARLAEEALRLACAGDCADAEVLAYAMRGLALVMEGRSREGLALLDEAAAAALGGDISDPYAAGLTCCYLISACDRVRDYERAAQWCARLREFSTRQRFAILLTTCRLQYSSVLTSRGAWAEAEAELLAAIDDLRVARPVVLPAAYARLGELRRRQGRNEEAAELFAQAGSHPLALLGGAWLDLEAGAFDAAADRVHAYLRRVPNDALLERAPANKLLVRIAASADRLDEGRSALEELERGAAALQLPLLRAAALAAAGILARATGENDRAHALLEDAAVLYEESGLAYEAAATRRALVAARDRSGAGDSAFGSGAAQPAGAPLTKRELDVLRLVARGMSEREVADTLYISPHTAHRHLSNIRLKLGVATQAAAVAHALRVGML
jgi:LuxR family maltose regulon positive regulatory protein